MKGAFSSVILRRLVGANIALLCVIVIGTVGYKLVGGSQYSIMDCLYMTVITITTIGYGEVIDLSKSPAGRIFTMLVALSGIGILTYILSTFTAYVVEGEMNEAFRRRKMKKIINELRDHFVVCGVEGAGFYIVRELFETGRDAVLVVRDRSHAGKVLDVFPETAFVVGDATDGDTLQSAGITRARGVFAVMGDDNENLVISLTAKQLNPGIRVVARCNDIKNTEKIRKAGADTVVSPTYIGGLRMASEMVRPAVVSFLDVMLRDREKNLRIEEITVPAGFSERQLGSLNLRSYRHSLLLAARVKGEYVYNPADDFKVLPGHVLVFMTTPDGRKELEGAIR